MTGLTSPEIQGILPHRYPFLFVDRILEMEVGQWAVGVKAVSVDEPFFQGHFPGYPVMPGVLIAEALAQVGAVAILPSRDMSGRIAYLAGMDNFRFRRQVVPGDLLRLEVTLKQVRTRAGKGHGVASVEGELVAEGDITFVIGPGLQ